MRPINIFHFLVLFFVFYGVSFDDFLGGMRVQTSKFAFFMNSYFSIFMLMLFYREMFSIFFASSRFKLKWEMFLRITCFLIIIMFQFFWIFFMKCCDFFGFRTDAVATGEHFCIFFVDWGRKIGGVFFCGKWGAKAKRHGKNNHFYNAKSEAEVTWNSNSFFKCIRQNVGLKVTRKNLSTFAAKFNSDFVSVQLEFGDGVIGDV